MWAVKTEPWSSTREARAPDHGANPGPCLNENGSAFEAHRFDYLSPSTQSCLGSIRKCGLGEAVPLGAGSKVPKPYSTPLASCCGYDVTLKLLLLEQASLPAAILPAMVVMDSKLEL